MHAKGRREIECILWHWTMVRCGVFVRRATESSAVAANLRRRTCVMRSHFFVESTRRSCGSRRSRISVAKSTARAVVGAWFLRRSVKCHTANLLKHLPDDVEFHRLACYSCLLSQMSLEMFSLLWVRPLTRKHRLVGPTSAVANKISLHQEVAHLLKINRGRLIVIILVYLYFFLLLIFCSCFFVYLHYLSTVIYGE